MKITTKILALLLSLILVLSFAACSGKKQPTNTDPKAPTTSSEPEKEDNSSQEVESEEEKEDEKEDETESKEDPVVTKKTPKELIVGKWTAKTDISQDLINEGYEVDGQVLITLVTEFTAGGTLIERADKNQMSTVMRNVLNQAINKYIAQENITIEQYEEQVIGMKVNEYIEEVVALMQSMYTYTTEYKFEGDTLLVGEPGSMAETNYNFITDNKLEISTDSEEIIYTRIS